MKHKHVAVIGAGRQGIKIIECLHELGVLKAVCDTNMNLKDKIQKYSGVEYYCSHKDLLSDYQTNRKPLDLCIIATPASTHYNIAIDILEQKIHLFIEKPLSCLLAHTINIIDKSEQQNVTVTCGYSERFHPAIEKLKQIVDSKKFGELMNLRFVRESENLVGANIKRINDVGVVFDTSVHDIDLALYLFGVYPTFIWARTTTNYSNTLPECQSFSSKTSPQYEDHAEIVLGFDKRSARITSSWASGKKERKIEATFSNGFIEGTLLPPNSKLTCSDKSEFIFPVNHALKDELKDLISPLPKGCMKVCIGKDAKIVEQIADAVFRSSREQRAFPLSL